MPVTIQQRADLFHDLTLLERSGLAAQQSFALLENQNPQLQQLQKYLSLGKSISEAGFKSAVFSAFDKTMVHAGESSGWLKPYSTIQRLKRRKSSFSKILWLSGSLELSI